MFSGEVLLVNIGATASGARVVSVKADMAKIVLQSPVCTEVDEKIALSRRIDKHWRLIGEFRAPFISTSFANSKVEEIETTS